MYENVMVVRMKSEGKEMKEKVMREKKGERDGKLNGTERGSEERTRMG